MVINNKQEKQVNQEMQEQVEQVAEDLREALMNDRKDLLALAVSFTSLHHRVYEMRDVVRRRLLWVEQDARKCMEYLDEGLSYEPPRTDDLRVLAAELQTNERQLEELARVARHMLDSEEEK